MFHIIFNNKFEFHSTVEVLTLRLLQLLQGWIITPSPPKTLFFLLERDFLTRKPFLALLADEGKTNLPSAVTFHGYTLKDGWDEIGIFWYNTVIPPYMPPDHN